MVGQEQRSERRLEGRPEYSGASRVHLHPHRARITATQLTGTQVRISELCAAELWVLRRSGIPRPRRSSGLWIPR